MVVTNKLQKRMALRRKLHILRALNTSKHVKNNTSIKHVLLSIYKLKHKMETIKKDHSNLMTLKNECLNILNLIQVPKEVKVEKTKEGFMVRVRCKKSGETLVSILEVFEEMGLNIGQARVSCNTVFSMEAIAVPDDQQHQVWDVNDVTQALVKAIDKQILKQD